MLTVARAVSLLVELVAFAGVLGVVIGLVWAAAVAWLLREMARNWREVLWPRR